MVRSWLDWAEQLGISFGCTPEDKCRQCHLPGKAPCSICLSDEAEKAGISPTPNHTWQSGLRRLRLGRIMETPTFRAGTVEVPIFGECLPYRDFTSTDDLTLETFSIGIERLATAVDLLGSPTVSRPIGDWIERFGRAVDLTLRPRQKNEADLFERGAALGRLQRLGRLEPCLKHPLPFGLVRLATTSGEPAASPGFQLPLYGGVALLPLADGCTIPFKDVYAMGFGEKQFPGVEPRSTLDLLPAGPRDGDERKRTAFLQCLLSVRERLTITYSNLDPAKEAVLNPSSVLVQLRDLVRADLLVEGDDLEPRAVPDTVLSPRYLRPGGTPGSHDPLTHLREQEWLAAMLAADHYGLLSPEASQDIRRRVDERLLSLTLAPPLREPAGSETKTAERTRRVGISQLVAFLRDPASAVANRVIRKYESDDDELLEVDRTPLFWNPLQKQSFLTRAMREYVLSQESPAAQPHPPSAPPSPREFFDRFFTWETLLSRAPDGVWGRLQHEETAERFTQVVQMFQDFFSDTSLPSFETLCLGHHGTAASDRVLSATRIACFGNDDPRGSSGEIELTGRLPFTWSDSDGLHVMVFRMTPLDIRPPQDSSQPVPPVGLEHFMLSPILFHIALSVQDFSSKKLDRQRPLLIDGRPLFIHACCPDKVATLRFEMTEEQAAGYLKELVGDYLESSGFEDLRLQVVKTTLPLPADASMGSEQAPSDSGNEAYRSRLSDRLESMSFRAPARFDSDLFKALPEPGFPADVLDKVKRRLQPLLPTPVFGPKGGRS